MESVYGDLYSLLFTKKERMNEKTSWMELYEKIAKGEVEELKLFLENQFEEKMSEKYQNYSKKKTNNPLQQKTQINLNDEKQKMKENYLNSQNTKYGLYPIHISVIFQRNKILDYLIEFKCDLNVADFSGNTCLHHCAVVGDFEMIEHLLNNGANQEIKNNYEATFKDLLSLLHQNHTGDQQELLMKEEGERKKYFFHSDFNQISSMKKENFKKLSGAFYLKNESKISQVEWLKMWKYSCKNELELNDFLEKLRSLYRNYNQKKTQKKTYMEHSDQIGFYLRADEDINQFEIIGEYFGEYSSVKRKVKDDLKDFEFEDNTEKDYNLDGIDAIDFRGSMGKIKKN